MLERKALGLMGGQLNFSLFFDLMEGGLLKAVEESRIKGKINSQHKCHIF